MALRQLSCLLAVSLMALPALAQDKPPEISEQVFRGLSRFLLENPTSAEAAKVAKGIVVFVFQTPDAAVVVGEEELKWLGDDKSKSLVLMAAYMAGNTESQLNSGYKRNDRYSGLLYLFKAYRTFQSKDKDFKIPAVEELMKLHRQDKLMSYLVELEKKKPTKVELPK